MRNYKAQLFVTAFATIIALPMPVLAHSGGTDSSGCHTNRKTGDYHCHGGGTQRAPTPAPFFGSGQGAYENCTAARAAGAAPVYRGDPGMAPILIGTMTESATNKATAGGLCPGTGSAPGCRDRRGKPSPMVISGAGRRQSLSGLSFEMTIFLADILLGFKRGAVPFDHYKLAEFV